MKALLYFTTFILCSFSITSCSFTKEKPVKQIVVKESNILTEKIDVKGMTCVGCEVTLEKKLKNIKGVVRVKASATADMVEISFDSTKTNRAELAEKIADAGYRPEN